MNKKMREILAKITDLRTQARTKQDAGNIKDAKDILDQIDTLQAEYDNEKRLYDAERNNVLNDPKPQDTINGFKVMAKIALNEPITEAEAALVTGGSNGEDYLVPSDVQTTINELRRDYKSAKELVGVMPTGGVLSGSFVFEKGTRSELQDFDDGNIIPKGEMPKFEQKSWKIHHKGRVFPVSNTLLEAETAGLMPYLDRYFVRNAIYTENKEIFKALKNGKTGTTIKGLSELEDKIIDLDEACKLGGVIITNKSGFKILNNETDALGNKILKKSASEPTKKEFEGMPIHVFDDVELPNVSGKPPVYYGSIKAGIWFMEKKGLQFATSDHIYFDYDQKGIRIKEGFDVMQADAEAYGYGLLVAADPKVVTTKAVAAEAATPDAE